MALHIGTTVKGICDKLGIRYIFKGSYRKANRSKLDSFTGIGNEKALTILKEVGDELGVETITDIHESHEAELAAKYVSHLQIPAFLCRQTDLLLAAAKTGCTVNVKKGQFVAPWDVANIVDKVSSAGNRKILITERGTMFGYNNLVVDFRGISIIRDSTGFPLIFDATHSVQLPGGQGNRSGGQREHAPMLAKAAVAAGADGVFMEVHPEPDKALCDGPNSLKLDDVPELLATLKALRQISDRAV